MKIANNKKGPIKAIVLPVPSIYTPYSHLPNHSPKKPIKTLSLATFTC